MKKLVLVAVIALIAVVAFALNAYAANDGNVVVSGQTNAKIVLAVDNHAVAFGTFEVDTPQPVASAFTAEVKANKNYDYYITAPANFTAGSTPAIGHLQWKRGAGVLAPFAGGDGNDALTDVAKTAGTSYTYDMELEFGYDEDPDVNYTADLTPTALFHI